MGLRRITVVPNAIAIPREVPKLPSAPRMLFLGIQYYKANAEAAERLSTNICRVRVSIPMPS